MNKIKKLPIEVYEKIKAGEVIEDPSSVIRELIDNSIDAKAKNIHVEIEEGGIGKILLSDDGEGMGKEDLEISYQQHTTSKIEKFEDIFALQTNGFRGEALSSIARVSQLKIVSCTDESGGANYIVIEGGKLLKSGIEARPKGTSIEVSSLFYNVPVRRNFLSPVKEIKKIKEEILVKALCHPEVSFYLKINKNPVLSLAAADWEDRMTEVFPDQKDNFISFARKSPDITVKGVITEPHVSWNTSSHLYFFINNRAVRPRFLYGVVNSVFSSLIPKGRYPAGAIYLYISPSHIDPNVHPSKKEIKILIEDQLFRFVYHALKEVFHPSEKKQEDLSQIKKFPETSETKIEKKQEKEEELTLDFQGADLPEEQSNSIDYKYLGTVFQTYLMAEIDDNLLFIDFHAAHERKRYEALKSRADKMETQGLLSPRILNFSRLEIEKVSEQRDIFKEIGFSFYLFGENSIVVESVPAFYQVKDWENDFKDLIHTLNSKSVEPENLKDELLKREACRGSYMSGETVPPNEAHALIKEVLEERFPLTCPHGRPFIYSMSKKQLAGNFLRKS
ncbi:MAG: hypothetical protein A2Y41_09800 [Spirochaetes bacterium GWB1_36_13]|nr:MAG: hypothetical protein A2Y41_09800 [Spirochaetes bacterium GWB1_36_13]